MQAKYIKVNSPLYSQVAKYYLIKGIKPEELDVILTKSGNKLKLKNTVVLFDRAIAVATLRGMTELKEELDKGTMKHTVRKGLYNLV